MGNTCAGPNLGDKGFLQSFTAAVWKPREKNLPSSGNGEDCTNKNEAKSEEPGDQSASVNPKGGGSEPPAPVQSTPPETVKITGEVSKSVDTIKSVRRETTFAKGEASKRAEAGKQNKPSHVKRISSVGLQVDSVLQRKTGNMKEVYSLGRKLGQGQFGTTFLCVEKGTGKEFACKTIAKRKLTTEEDVEDVRREIQIMHHLAGHPNVISIVDAYEDAVAVHVIMELCAGGELFDRIIQRGHYSERKAAELARIIVGVVEACHSLGVMHRDLKPENFLFINQEEESPLKTIDFGLSMFFKPGTIFKVDFLLLESIESRDEDLVVRL